MSRRRCAICFGVDFDCSEKKGQISHLDQNSSNNNIENLAFLCLDHHDDYDSKSSVSKNYSIKEVKEYRKQLYEWVSNQAKYEEGRSYPIFRKKDAALLNLLRIIQRCLSEIKYSYVVLTTLPEYDRNNIYSAVSPFKRPFNLRRMRSNETNDYVIFHPYETDLGEYRNRIVFFHLGGMEIDRKDLHKYITDSESINYYYDLVGQCVFLIKQFEQYWETLEYSDADAFPGWDISSYSQEDEKKAALRQIHKKHIDKTFGDMVRLVSIINDEFGASLNFDSNLERPSIHVGLRKFDS